VRGIPSYLPAEYVVNLQRVAPLHPLDVAAGSPRRPTGAFRPFFGRIRAFAGARIAFPPLNLVENCIHAPKIGSFGAHFIALLTRLFLNFCTSPSFGDRHSQNVWCWAGNEAAADGTTASDARCEADTTPLGQPHFDLQQLALFLAAQPQFQQPPQPNHRGGPASIFGAASHFGSLGAAGDIRVALTASFGGFCGGGLAGGGGYGGVGLAPGGLGYGAGGGSFSRGFASPADPPPAQRTVTFGPDPAGGDTISGDTGARRLKPAATPNPSAHPKNW
jgi:hypothetical protein